jgi:4-hydroxybenzoate polyprenyltransferase
MLTFVSLDGSLRDGWRHGRLVQRFMRTRNAKLPISLFVVVGVTRDLAWQELIAGSALLALIYGFVVIFNDINDAEGDRINRRDLPLATGELDAGQASRILIGLGVLICALVLAWGSAAPAIAVAAATVAGFIYSDPSIRISDRGIIGSGLLALCYIGTPILFVLTLTDGPYRQAVPVVVVGTLLAFATSLYKDFGDEAGDAAIGKLTPLVQYGSGRVTRLAILVQGTAMIVGALVVGVAVWMLPAALSLCSAAGVDSRWRPSVVVVHRYLTTGSICLLAAAGLG